MDESTRPCRACRRPAAAATIAVLARAGAPPESPEHQIAYSHLCVIACTACDHVELELFDHDCFDYEEVFDQYEWYVLDRAGAAATRRLVASCGRPLAPECACDAHEQLRAASRELPRRGWTFGVEHAAHVWPITTVITADGRLQFAHQGVAR